MSPKVQAEAERQYARFLADRSSIDPNIVPALVGILAANGDQARYDEFWAASKAQPRRRKMNSDICSRLPDSRDPGLLARDA